MKAGFVTAGWVSEDGVAACQPATESLASSQRGLRAPSARVGSEPQSPGVGQRSTLRGR